MNHNFDDIDYLLNLLQELYPILEFQQSIFDDRLMWYAKLDKSHKLNDGSFYYVIYEIFFNSTCIKLIKNNLTGNVENFTNLDQFLERLSEIILS